ncbi:hypothetical protein PE36_09021 [Moritella sp. PE36]|uniref:hypothetical protein n=1 Tax=Moritella sp. PE36 TaxID=58051 RepID=UPI0001569C87|nr:hypothetical protein [Moritella sp. PE36]EDM65435.1 hypothetical protein PE36_09021 [Moritella sp. PE36]
MKKIILTILIVMLPMGLFAKESKEQTFWKWFIKNESTIFEFEKNQDKVLDSISSQLSGYHEDVVFEISHIKDGKREFIISADGISDVFPHVESLVKHAPEFNQFSIIAFRPRIENYADFKLEYAGKEFDVSKVWIYSRVEDGYFDLIVYHPDFIEQESNIFISGSYILLDMAIGEYDVVKKIRYIDHQKLPDNPEKIGLKPFAELQKIFDEYKMANKSLKLD